MKRMVITETINVNGSKLWNGDTVEDLIRIVAKEREKGLRFVLNQHIQGKNYKTILKGLKEMGYTAVDMIIIIKAIFHISLKEASLFYQEQCI